MRVGLRRLRAAISLFSKLFGDKQTEQIKSELNWLRRRELSPARDLDVYERGTVEPLRRAAPATRGMKELEDSLASRRAAAFAKAKVVVDSPRYRSLLLDTLQWLEVGDWARRSRHFRNQPIERFAADILARRTKNATKKAKRLRQLDTRRRHKLRIAVKKLRYASDFFRRLFAGRKAKKRLSGFKACLTDLQDHLGALNDIAVHQKLGPKLVAGKSNTKVRARAFAARIVSGREQSEIEPLLKAAEPRTGSHPVADQECRGKGRVISAGDGRASFRNNQSADVASRHWRISRPNPRDGVPHARPFASDRSNRGSRPPNHAARLLRATTVERLTDRTLRSAFRYFRSSR
jgi:CHAD domain-containing protein